MLRRQANSNHPLAGTSAALFPCYATLDDFFFCCFSFLSSSFASLSRPGDVQSETGSVLALCLTWRATALASGSGYCCHMDNHPEHLHTPPCWNGSHVRGEPGTWPGDTGHRTCTKWGFAKGKRSRHFCTLKKQTSLSALGRALLSPFCPTNIHTEFSLHGV